MSKIGNQEALAFPECSMRTDDLLGKYEERSFPDVRIPTLDTLRWGHSRQHIPLLLEADVTAAREAIQRHRSVTGERISFTGWIIKCVAQAVSEHPSIHAIRKGKHRVVVFQDVDVALVIEREGSDAGGNFTLPMPYVIRRANEKSLGVIHSEIRRAQGMAVSAGEVQLRSPRASWATSLFIRIPRILRDIFFWRRLFRDPFRIKRIMGTVAVTAVGMMGPKELSWAIPVGIHPLIIAVGGITRRPGVLPASENVVIREYVGLTILFDHEVTDGAPVARFARRLQELMSEAYCLLELEGPKDS